MTKLQHDDVCARVCKYNNVHEEDGNSELRIEYQEIKERKTEDQTWLSCLVLPTLQLPFPEHYFRCHIGCNNTGEHTARRDPAVTFHLDIVVDDKMSENRLQCSHRKQTTRTIAAETMSMIQEQSLREKLYQACLPVPKNNQSDDVEASPCLMFFSSSVSL